MLRHHSDIQLCALCAAYAAKGQGLPSFSDEPNPIQIRVQRFLGLKVFRCAGCLVEGERPRVALSASVMELVSEPTLEVAPDEEPTQEMPRTQIARLAKVCADIGADAAKAQFIRSIA